MTSSAFLNANQLESSLNNAARFKDNENNKIYIIFPFLEYKAETIRTFKLKKLNFIYTNIINFIPSLDIYQLDFVYLKSLSCFTTVSNNIICLFNYWNNNDYDI